MRRKQFFLHFLRYLSENRLMTLATFSGKKPWVATVFFAFDKKGNLFFFSRPDTRHCRHITSQTFVAVAINHTWGKLGAIKAVQLLGHAERVSVRGFRKAYAVFRKRFPWADEFKKDHTLYIIKPTEIHMINQKVFGHFNRVQIM